jgi:hypothetical protein
VFENRVLRGLMHERDEVRGEWRRPQYEELTNLHIPNFNRVIQSRRLRWTEHVARLGERSDAYRV